LKIFRGFCRNTGTDAGKLFMGAGFRVQGSGFKVQGSRIKVQGSRFRVLGSGFSAELLKSEPQNIE
jgi:hypothetical protein